MPDRASIHHIFVDFSDEYLNNRDLVNHLATLA